MEFRKILTLGGPNIWARFPVLEAWIDLGDLKDSPSNSMPGFNDRIMRWLPQMIEHRCSIGERGGFFERLRRGTYLAHILEHVSLELQARAGTDVGFGRARETRTEGLFRVALEYEDETVGRAVLEAGRRLCLAAVNDWPYDVEQEIRTLRELNDEAALGPSSLALVNAAKARSIPVRRLNAASLLQLGYGARQRRVWTAVTDKTGAIAEAIAQDKELTRSLLRQVGVPVAMGRPVQDADDAWRAAVEVGLPVVVKPQHGNHGDGVVIGISKRDQVEAAYRFAAGFGNGVMVESFAPGDEHRLLVVGGKMVAATRGNPAFVVGDGRQTVQQLIESQLNSDPRRGQDLSFPLWPIVLNATVELALEQEGLTPESVPAKDQRVMIKRNGNLSHDVTDDVHPAVARHVELAARVIGLDVAGIDVIAEDIGKPLDEQKGAVIEVNAGPGLQVHVEPESGHPRPVGDAILATLFAPGETGRIPVVAVTGLDDTSPVTRLIAQLLSAPGRVVGATTAAGAYVAGQRIRTGDCRDARNGQGILLNPHVDAAVFDISIDSIVDEGLAFDGCDVAVVTRMGDGVWLDLEEGDTPAKKALAFRGITDVVLKYGATVMRAGEPLGPIIAEHCPGSVILFATENDESSLREHVAAGGKAVVARGGQICLIHGGQETVLAGLRGDAQSDALLPAVAAGWALEMPVAEIVGRLSGPMPF